jgi:CHAT domain-containing protein/tetratricopeptide (TPR) repeat protein
LDVVESFAAAKADSAAAIASTQPDKATALALEALEQANLEGDQAAASVALRTLGLMASVSRRIDEALGHLREAIRVAEDHQLARHAALARIVLVATLTWAGEPAQALREVELAAPFLHGMERGRLEMRRGLALYSQGRLDEALKAYRQALPVLRRAKDHEYEARLLNNRSMLHYQRGDMGAAEADLRRAERLFEALGQHVAVAEIWQNLGYVIALRGDLPTALGWFDRADAFLHAHGIVDELGLRDRCEVLLRARLVAEARRFAEQAIRQLAAKGNGAYLAEVQLLLSEATLLDGDPASASALAAQALDAFTGQGRPTWMAIARYTGLRAAWAAGEASVALLRDAQRAARELAAAGWKIPALDARLIAAQLALALGQGNLARRELLQARRARRRGSVDLRSRAWHAEALVRLADGDRRGAEAGLRAGMRALDNFRSAVGGTELRTYASAHVADLATLGLRLALEDGDPRRVLAWAERWRASNLLLRPVRPPDDSRLADTLAELRWVAGDLHRAILAGEDPAALRRREELLEAEVRRHARRIGGEGPARLAPPPPVGAISEALGERALVEIVELDGQLHAVVVAQRRVWLRSLGTHQSVVGELEALRLALRRLAFSQGRDRWAVQAAEAARFSARRLDDLLLGPIRDRIGARPLVLVPTGALHALPWMALPSCSGRTLSVAPSTALWLRAVRTPSQGPLVPSRVVLVSGPGLPGAAAETAELLLQYPAAECLRGEFATVSAVSRALGTADLAHIAAHGKLRVDNSLLSCLELADGPLMVYDLESLAGVPRCLVLSACDSGLSDIRPGDELMGLAGALFALGAGTLVAPVIPVPDSTTSDLMVAFHLALQQGLGPAAALARAQHELEARSGITAVSAGFVCFGAG